MKLRKRRKGRHYAVRVKYPMCHGATHVVDFVILPLAEPPATQPTGRKD